MIQAKQRTAACLTIEACILRTPCTHDAAAEIVSDTHQKRASAATLISRLHTYIWTLSPPVETI
jgi:hypothetical protein